MSGEEITVTLMLRILVVNTLTSSLATEKSTCVPTPSKTTFDRIKRKVVEFIWKAKRPKRAYQTLIKDRPEGKLKLIDFQCKEQALKISRIKKIKERKDVFLNDCASRLLSAPEEVLWNNKLTAESQRLISEVPKGSTS